jgi:hypothetical protein
MHLATFCNFSASQNSGCATDPLPWLLSFCLRCSSGEYGGFIIKKKGGGVVSGHGERM